MHGGGCALRGHAWQGVYMARGHVWQGTCMVQGMHDRDACMAGVCMAGGVHGRGVCVAGGMHGGGMCGRGFVWGEGVHVWWGHAWQESMHNMGHVWWGVVCGRGHVSVCVCVCVEGGCWRACMVGACVAGVYMLWGCGWQGACVVGCVCGGGTYMCGGGHAWHGMCMAGGGMHYRGVCAWKERRSQQRAVGILLECILVCEL